MLTNRMGPPEIKLCVHQTVEFRNSAFCTAPHDSPAAANSLKTEGNANNRMQGCVITPQCLYRQFHQHFRPSLMPALNPHEQSQEQAYSHRFGVDVKHPNCIETLPKPFRHLACSRVLCPGLVLSSQTYDKQEANFTKLTSKDIGSEPLLSEK